MSAQAKRAYEAFVKTLHDATPNPWDDLAPLEQEAWRDAVAAAIDTPAAAETLTDVQVRMLDELGTVKLGRAVKAALPEGKAFLLFTADYGDGGNLAYVATVCRDDAIRLVREWLRHQGAL